MRLYFVMAGRDSAIFPATEEMRGPRLRMTTR
jgi:hypothetical protein